MISGRHKYRTHAHTQNIFTMRPTVSVHAPYPAGPGFNSQPEYPAIRTENYCYIYYSGKCPSVNLTGYEHFILIPLFDTIQSQRTITSVNKQSDSILLSDGLASDRYSGKTNSNNTNSNAEAFGIRKVQNVIYRVSRGGMCQTSAECSLR